MDAVVRDSVRLGTRYYTIAAAGTPTRRIYLEPEKDWIGGLRVFLCHTTADLAWADHVRDLLEDLGFQVSYLRNDGPPQVQKRDDEISAMLENAIHEADYMCMLFSKASAARPWVRHEFKVAARLIGRVTMLRDDSVGDISDFEIPQFERRALLTVKYQVLGYSADEPEMGRMLGRMILTDPDEGVTDGTYRPLVVRERNLRLENYLRRIVRLRLDDIDMFSKRQRHVIDVLPFLWSDVGGRTTDVSKVVEWFVTRHGCLNLRVRLGRGRVEAVIVEVPATVESERWTKEPSVNALVVWTNSWDAETQAVMRNRGSPLF